MSKNASVTVMNDEILKVCFLEIVKQRKNFSIRRHAGIWSLRIGGHLGTGRTLGEALRAVPAE